VSAIRFTVFGDTLEEMEAKATEIGGAFYGPTVAAFYELEPKAAMTVAGQVLYWEADVTGHIHHRHRYHNGACESPQCKATQ